MDFIFKKIIQATRFYIRAQLYVCDRLQESLCAL